jgi:hypothetical protein
LSDQETREKVLDKQRRQATVAERQTRRGTMTSDIPSDFDTESGSSPLISSEFSEPEDLTDQEEEKKAAQTEAKMTVEEQVRMIQAMKAGKVMSLPVNLPEGRMRTNKQRISNTVQSPSLPPEISTYTPSDRPLHSLPQGGDGHTYHTFTSSSISDGTSTLENERLSNNTLKEEENCYGGSSRFSVGSCGGPATHSSTDGSTLTGGSFEGRFTSLRLPSGTSSEKNEDVLGMVNSPTAVSLPASQSSLTQSPMQGQLQRVLPASSPMDASQSDLERSSYYRAPSEEVQSMESDIRDSLSPAHAPPTFQPGRYRLPSSQVQQMCQRVDDVKEKYQEELLRIRHKEQLMRQGAPDISHEEQRRTIPVSYMYIRCTCCSICTSSECYHEPLTY